MSPRYRTAEPDFFGHRFSIHSQRSRRRPGYRRTSSLSDLPNPSYPSTLVLEMAADTSKSVSNPNNDPARSGYHPDKYWTSVWNILTGKMSSRGQEDFREDAYIRNEERDCKRCDEWRDYCFKYSPMVRFMQKNIRDLNGDLNEENVQCRRCPTRRLEDGTEDGVAVRQSGGFDPRYGILICANEMRDRKHLEDTLSHEMVHAWDHLRWKVNWMDLRHAACSEVSFTL